MTIASLSAMTLPLDSGFKRDDYVPKPFQFPEYQSQYDASTLIYDAILIPGKKRICLICPKLLNLEAALRDGTFSSSSGNHAITKIYRYKRYDEVWLKCAGRPDRLRFTGQRLDLECPLSVQDTASFEGLNCAVLKSKDNDLAWIRDWAEYHVRIHGLEGVVFFDNNSSKYSPEEVDAVLGEVAGIKRSVVIPTPFAFGPRAMGKYRTSCYFLQVGILNIARLRYFQKAKAVLSVDVDELVSPTPEGSIFETTRRSLLGYTLFRGRWRDVNGSGAIPNRHLDHIYVDANDLCSMTKYCIVPGGPFGFSHWDVHGAVRGILKDRMTTDRFHYWHCREITTNWRIERRSADPDKLHRDDDLAGLLGRVYQV